MKLPALFCAVLLGLPVLVRAQTSPASAGLGKGLNFNADGSLTMPPGKLGELVAEIERRIPDWPQKPAGEARAWPNIIYAPTVINREMPSPLRLRMVEPIQAVTLVAAAAGCTLEPIFAPKEAPEAATQKLIGYRIALEGAFAPGAGWGQSRVKAIDPGLPGVTSALNIPGGNKSMGGGSAPASTDAFANPAMASAADNRPFVRVYALGTILRGSPQETGDKQHRFEILVHDALGLAESGPDAATSAHPTPGTPGEKAAPRKPPEFLFHYETGALVVKATAAEHEIIEQVVKVLKESEALPARITGR